MVTLGCVRLSRVRVLKYRMIEEVTAENFSIASVDLQFFIHKNRRKIANQYGYKYRIVKKLICYENFTGEEFDEDKNQRRYMGDKNAKFFIPIFPRVFQFIPWVPRHTSENPTVAPTILCVPEIGSFKNVATISQNALLAEREKKKLVSTLLNVLAFKYLLGDYSEYCPDLRRFYSWWVMEKVERAL